MSESDRTPSVNPQLELWTDVGSQDSRVKLEQLRNMTQFLDECCTLRRFGADTENARTAHSCGVPCEIAAIPQQIVWGILFVCK